MMQLIQNHAEYDRNRSETHRRSEVNNNQRHGLTCGRDILGDKEHEHREGQQDSDAQSDLFARVRRQ